MLRIDSTAKVRRFPRRSSRTDASGKVLRHRSGAGANNLFAILVCAQAKAENSNQTSGERDVTVREHKLACTTERVEAAARRRNEYSRLCSDAMARCTSRTISLSLTSIVRQV